MVLRIQGIYNRQDFSERLKYQFNFKRNNFSVDQEMIYLKKIFTDSYEQTPPNLKKKKKNIFSRRGSFVFIIFILENQYILQVPNSNDFALNYKNVKVIFYHT